MGLKAVVGGGSGGGAGSFTSLTISGLFTQAAEDGITAFSGGGKASATPLLATKNLHRVSTVAAPADSILMPPALVGQAHYVRNDGASNMQVFGAGTDTINSVATATGISHGAGMGVWYVCTTTGNWTTGAVTTIRATTGFQGPQGSGAAVVYGFGAANTGIYANGNNNVSISTAGATVAQFTSTGVFIQNVKIVSYNTVLTAGFGIPAIVAAGRVTAQSAANASISTFTVGVVDGTFEVSANMNVTVVTTLVTTLTVNYTDESNTARSMIFPIQQLSGSFIAAGAITGLGAWVTPVMHIRCKAGTAITILTSAGTFTGVTYTAEGIIKQVA